MLSRLSSSSGIFRDVAESLRRSEDDLFAPNVVTSDLSIQDATSD